MEHMFQPKLYFTTEKNTPYKTIDGRNLTRKTFSGMKTAKEFIKSNKNVAGLEVFGHENFTTQFINEVYKGKTATFDEELIRIAYLDIETGSEDGFPEPELANQPVHLITVFVKDARVTFGLFPDITIKDGTYHYCETEEKLLDAFLEFWELADPDIVTGWNINKFDIIYLFNRINRLLGKRACNRLSPWGMCWKHPVTGLITLKGIETLDYFDLYLKFKLNDKPENFKLDTVAEHELKVKKLSYELYGSLHNLYLQNPQLYTEYNIRDVELIQKLEEKLSMIFLSISMAYITKCNYSDVFMQTRLWDSLIYHHLSNKNIMFHTKMDPDHIPDGEDYVGGFVKQPNPGRFNWTVFFDATSLYPSTMISYNLGPDTILPKYRNISVEKILEGGTFTDNEHEIMAANGQFFRRDINSFLAEILVTNLINRKKYKDLMKAALQDYEKTKDIKFKNLAAKYDILQQAFKVNNNSAYGYIGSRFSRFYDVRIAEAITLGGQLLFKHVEKSVNVYLNNFIKSDTFIDFIVAGDTDSLVINFGPLIDKYCPDVPKTKKIEFIKRFDEKYLQPLIKKVIEELSVQMNLKENKLEFKREALCEAAIWTAKKNYICSVWADEEVVYKYPKIKIKGMKAVRSDTPNVCRKHIKNAYRLILTSNEDKVKRYVNLFKERFFRLRFDEIAKPIAANDMEKWLTNRGETLKGCPIQVRAANNYNKLINELQLTKKYDRIRSGDKIKLTYLKMPNPIGQNVIAIPSYLPEEFNLLEYVDYDTQFEKTFLKPVNAVLDVIGWSASPKSELYDFIDIGE